MYQNNYNFIERFILQLVNNFKIFYYKLGFKIQNFEHLYPPYRKEYEGHSLRLMSYNKDLQL